MWTSGRFSAGFHVSGRPGERPHCQEVTAMQPLRAVIWSIWINSLPNIQTPRSKSLRTSVEPPLQSCRLNGRRIGWDTGLKKTLHASEQEREDVKLKREQWMLLLPSLDPDKLLFLDKSGVKTNMTRLSGRARHGLRLFAHAPHGHGAQLR
jgi:hypothetical protein